MKGTLERAREALHDRDFRFLLSSRLLSTAGDGLFNATIVALTAFNPEQSTAAGFAKALAILLIPYSAIGPFTGVFIDRWSRRKILVWTPLLRATMLALLLGGNPDSPWFLAGALIAASANRFFSAAGTASIPKLVADEDLMMANSMTGIGGTIIMSVFAFAGGLLADAAGDRPVLVSIAVAWLCAAALARAIRNDLTATHTTEMRLRHAIARVAGEFADGIRRLSRSPAALAPIATIGWDQFLQGIAFVLSLVVFRERFAQGVGSYSWLLAAGAIGLLIGVGLVGKLEERLPKGRIVAIALAVSGIGLLSASLAITRATVLVEAFLVGLVYPWKKVPIDTLVQEAVPDDYRGRVFAVYDVFFNVGRVGATALAVWLVPAAGVRGTLLVCGAGSLIWIPLMARWLTISRRIDVRFYEGARAEESPRAIVMFGQEIPVAERRSWSEDRAGLRLRCFRVETAEGRILDISRWDSGGPWMMGASN